MRFKPLQQMIYFYDHINCLVLLQRKIIILFEQVCIYGKETSEKSLGTGNARVITFTSTSQTAKNVNVVMEYEKFGNFILKKYVG